MNAIWGQEYDWRKEKMYDCPVCPKCREEVGKIQGKYVCFACGEEMEIDEQMLAYFRKRGKDAT